MSPPMCPHRSTVGGSTPPRRENALPYPSCFRYPKFISTRYESRVYIYTCRAFTARNRERIVSSSFDIDRKIGSRDSSCGSHPPLLFASGSRYTFDSCNKGIRGRAIALRLLAPSRAAPWFSTVVENELGSDRSMDLSFDDRFEGRLSDSISRSRPLFSSLLFPARTSYV